MTSGAQPSQANITIDDVCLTDIPQIIEIDSEITKIAKPELWYSYYAPAGRSQPRWFLVAHEGERVVGYILGEVRAWEFGSPPCGWIFAIGVSPDQRIGGIGSRLLGAMIERFRPTGVKTIRTMLHIDEHVLMSFFRSQGMAAGPFIQLEASIDL
ncbi:MAG: GNAT family N-acetyltransferase [Beijerinckiaceae bacterium]|jgi:GNAT superfamily N-acetyltransferase|nr:GNAT family N-acetyltransferase [Beijerinckiaceae bacterium]MDO9443441.1 GNAT family N-acetyltransferase [Beijerinckiaceae bacterium]